MAYLLLLGLRVNIKLEKRENRKKAPGGDFVKISLSVPFNLLSMFDEESKRRGYTRSEAVRQGMRRLLETWTGRRL